MELIIHYTTLPEGKAKDDIHRELDALLEEDGWFTLLTDDRFELELEDEKQNPKFAILIIKNYLKSVKFPADTTIELCGTSVGIYE